MKRLNETHSHDVLLELALVLPILYPLFVYALGVQEGRAQERKRRDRLDAEIDRARLEADAWLDEQLRNQAHSPE